MRYPQATPKQHQKHTIPADGDPFVAFAQELEHTPCSHCLDTGWVMLTAENDFGELEDYFVLCRKCKGGSRGLSQLAEKAQ